MKKHLVLKAFVLSVVSVFTLLCVFSPSLATVKGGKHDLSLGGGGTSGGAFQFQVQEVCVFCHTPHGANSDVREDTTIDTGPGNDTYDIGTGNRILLWNRALANLGTGAYYSPYQSSSMNSQMSQIRVYSLLCLSCHDGVSAMNVLVKNPVLFAPDANGNVLPRDLVTDQFADAPGVSVNIGGREDTSGADTEVINLSDDHPVGIDYTSALALADTGLTAPTSFVDVANGIVYQETNPSVLANAIGVIRLFPSGVTGANTSVECSTCHDVHATPKDADGTSGFLAVSNSNSALCTACHLK
jgi:hypothetical protein